jgi:vacuolar-type H+-ATPase subunit I/STV1
VRAVPDDFPRELPRVSPAGSRAKVAVRRIEGRYRAGYSEEEMLERYQACEDLAEQLASYCARKAKENPSWSWEFNLSRVRERVAQKVNAGLWEVSEAEQIWVMARVHQLFVG